ncbi:MAG: gluconate 2-dehydrogenase subunit 3 family protein [Gemmatimonadaceae bacterium]
MSDANTITRREALARTALLLGGALATSTVAGAQSDSSWLLDTQQWRPRTLSPTQAELVATLAEHIIPATDTPGARAAGVHRFVDAIVTDYYSAEERKRFLSGLGDIDARAQKASGTTFLKTTPQQQVALLTALDGESYPPQRVLQKAEPLSSERQKMQDSLARQSSTGVTISDPTRAAADAGGNETARRELERGWFFRRMKELTLLGYYTSEAGAMTELKVNPMGVYRSDVPYRSIGHAWA